MSKLDRDHNTGTNIAWWFFFYVWLGIGVCSGWQFLFYGFNIQLIHRRAQIGRVTFNILECDDVFAVLCLVKEDGIILCCCCCCASGLPAELAQRVGGEQQGTVVALLVQTPSLIIEPNRPAALVFFRVWVQRIKPMHLSLIWTQPFSACVPLQM